MNKIILILKREYLTRVKKKSFLLLTVLMPVLFGGIMAFVIYINTKENTNEQKVAVIDRSGLFLGELKDSPSTKFIFVPIDEYQSIKDSLKESGYYGLLEIPENILSTNKVFVYSHKQISMDVKGHIDWQLEQKLEEQKRAELVHRVGIPNLEEQLAQTKSKITVETFRMDEGGKGKKGSTEVAMIAGYIAGFIIYMFVFIYGNMVMRGVQEEKQNRIVEVIISSVKPIQLMMGKILGLALVGITQFAIWIVLIAAIMFGIQKFMITDKVAENMIEMQSQNIMMQGAGNSSVQVMNQVDASEAEKIFEQIQSVDFTGLIFALFVYFLLGYLLYSSLMAAIASAVDSEEDMQQFMIPITIPLVAAMIMLMNVIKDPEGSLAFWGSMIPFTSPIIMMVRIPFGVPWYEIVISLTILALSTYGAIWVAAKIYRTGILMYGKKPTWKELGKWLTYRN
ncbi:MAG: ABC transporter permease [Prolixibacteraceae bacterium]